MTAPADKSRIGSSIQLEHIRVGYGGRDVLSGIDLTVEAGAFVALLGASGCGKTTLLRAVAGFVPLLAGRILLDGENIADVPPDQRGTAMMFQSYALWPHMNVAQNVGYGLRLRGRSRMETAQKVAALLDMVGLSGLDARKPAALSGGQRQRVALARALAIDPPVLLLDEPLSNLDAGIRANMRHEIRNLQERLGLTTILVTHDQSEALTMADRIVVLNDGQVAQIGTPEEIYHHPASAYVARFMGADNELPVAFHETGERRVPRLAGPADPAHHRLYFRSDAARIGPADAAATDGFQMSGTVRQSSYLGATYRHTLDVGGHHVMVDHHEKIHVGTAVDMCVPAAGLHIFTADGAAAAGEAEPLRSPTPHSRDSHNAT